MSSENQRRAEQLNQQRGPGGLINPPERLDGPAEAAQRRFRRLMATLPNGDAIEEGLRGRQWLGHPLHPLLTDVVVGAWTAAWVFDMAEMLGAKRLAPGADAAVALGLASSLPTALSGAADWNQTSGVARRLGLVHGSLNVLGTLLYSMSLINRIRGRRRAAHVWGHLGFGVASASAYLGGELVYDAGVQVLSDGARGALEDHDGEDIIDVTRGQASSARTATGATYQ